MSLLCEKAACNAVILTPPLLYVFGFAPFSSKISTARALPTFASKFWISKAIIVRNLILLHFNAKFVAMSITISYNQIFDHTLPNISASLNLFFKSTNKLPGCRRNQQILVPQQSQSVNFFNPPQLGSPSLLWNSIKIYSIDNSQTVVDRFEPEIMFSRTGD